MLVQHPGADIIIVGAGIIGMLSAWELARREPEQHILIIDRGKPGNEASWAGGGILSPLRPWHYPRQVQKLCRQSQEYYPALCAELQQRSGIDPELIVSGLLILSDAQETGRGVAWAQAHGSEYEHLQGGTIRRDHPELSVGDEEGLWLPRVAQVRNPRLLQALQGALQANGVEFLTGTAVRGLLTEGGRINAVETDAGPIASNTVVLACGAWTPELLPPDSWRPDIRPVKGQMLLYETEPALLNTIVLRGDRYLVPRKDGGIVAGSSMEEDGFSKSPTVEVKQQIRDFAESLLPALANCNIGAHWTGLRPASADGIPVIGPHPGIDGLWLNAGHHRNGLTMAPASARILAEQMVAAR